MHTTDPWAGPAVVAPAGVDVFPVAMITGHRPEKLAVAERAWAQAAIARAVARLRGTYATSTAISGMARGADTWYGHAALAAGMDLHAFVPFETQAAKWTVDDQAVWSELCSRAKAVNVVAPGPAAAWKFHARNDAMLDATAASGGLVVAILRPGASGGTAATYDKARTRGLPVLRLDPTTRTMTREGW